MAAETGFSHTTIGRKWTAFGLQPQRSQTFKLSSDPLFVDKVRDIVWLYPNRAIVLSVDETIKARWICEQAHQQLKEELGLDHFEGRSWQGLHRHALMTMIAYAFLQHHRLAYAGQKKENQRASASTNHARRTFRHRRSHPSAAVSAVPILPKANP
ncbi:SRSO17 transposase [Bradyrhizobium sp. USDA 377]